MNQPKVYTRQGDEGMTSLVEGTRVSKSDQRLHAYGTVDELNSVLGLLHAKAVTQAKRKPRLLKTIISDIDWIQDSLFILGSHLATSDDQFRTKLPAFSTDGISRLEKRMDEMSAKLPQLKNFILPGQDELSALAHMARTICRRAERWTVAVHNINATTNPDFVVFLNRLSDYFFVLSRYLQVVVAKKKERIWRSS